MSVSPDHLQQRHFVQDMDIPSSSSTSRPIDIPPNNSYRLSGHWESIDFTNPSPGFAYTPSYVGSFGSQQDSVLHNWGERESTAVLQSHNPSGDLFDDVKYEPEAYAHPDVQSGQATPYLLMDNNQAVFNPSGNDLFVGGGGTDVPYAAFDSAGTDPSRHFSPRSAGEIYSAGSPASSLGGFADPQLAGPTDVNSRSRASSVSSYHDASPYMHNTSVSEHFDRLNFESDPYQQRPSTGQAFTHDMSSPPIQSPELTFSSPATEPTTSPPALMIPTDSVNTILGPNDDTQQPPADPLGNVAINFVPATPVSAGGLGGNAVGGFQKILADLARVRHQPPSFDRGNASVSGGLPSFSSFSTGVGVGVGASGDSGVPAAAPRGAQQQDSLGWGSLLRATGQSQGTASSSSLPQQNRLYPNHGYMAMLPTFTSSPTANSQTPPHQQAQQQQQQQSDTTSPPTATTPSMSVDLQQHQPLPPTFSHHTQSDSVLSTSSAGAGGHLGLGGYNHTAGNSDTALNSMMGLDDFLAAPILASRSRSKSDVSARGAPIWFPSQDPSSSSSSISSTTTSQMPQHSLQAYPTFDQSQQRVNNQSLLGAYPSQAGPSLDLTLGVGDFAALGGGLKRANSDGSRGAHRRAAKSEDLSALMRGSRLAPPGSSDIDYVRSITMADGSLAPVDPRVAGPTRRRGSGSGHERNASLSSLRSTPYSIRASPHSSPGQSPHHSPNGGAVALPVPLHDPSQSGVAQAQQQPQQAILRVERALVTTPATKTASANRRRAEANFVCPVPNCGSTFTRHFNLRGHMRSHNEERPFKCKWPGCEKGFARQHDCKRHEALHLNIRPYTCEGCQKTFARMDALNRHLRSEGGVDCQKHHQSSEESSDHSGNDATASVEPKVEDTTSIWNQTGTIMM